LTKLVFMQKGGIPVSNYATTTLVNNTAATRTLTVPAGEIWYVAYGQMTNGDNVARACRIQVLENSSILYMYYSASLGASTRVIWPNQIGTTPVIVPDIIPLKAGWKIIFTWDAGGASAGGTAQSCAVTQELKAV
jgi:hypothetical protein